MNTATQLTEQEIPAFARERMEGMDSQISIIVEGAAQLCVTNKEEYEHAATYLIDVKDEIKSIEASRKELVGPVNETVKKINNAAKMRTEPLMKVERDIKAKISTYATKQEAIAEKEAARVAGEQEVKEKAAKKAADDAAKKLADAKESGDTVAAAAAASDAEQASAALTQAAQPQAIEKPEINCRTENGNTHIKKVWKFEVTDAAAVPVGYLVVDEKKISQAIKDGMRDIQGVRIYQENQVAVR